MSQLTFEELQCLTEKVDFSRLLELQEDTRLATAEETKAAIDCLGDETALRALLTERIGLTGPLSEATSSCLRATFKEFDFRSVLFAMQVASEDQTSVVGSASAFLLTLSCLNEEEWEEYVPAVVMNTDGRDKLGCVVETLGGHEELAATLQSIEDGIPERFLNASTDCDLEIGFLPGG